MKILIVDDSALMRQTITDILKSIPDARIYSARDGKDALDKLEKVQPDVITLDINMPAMDGLTCLSHIMVQRPKPVIMLSSLSHEGAVTTLEALHMGAVDYVAKPGGTICGNLRAVSEELVQKVLAAVANSKPIEPIRQSSTEQSTVNLSTPSRAELAIVGVSTGGPSVVEELLKGVSTTCPWPILVAQHMPENFTLAFAQRLNKVVAMPVQEVTKATELLPGHAYICKGDRDCIVSRRGNSLVAMPTPKETKFAWHPSVSKLVASATRVCGARNLVTVMMTGMGNDGASEMANVAQSGGVVFAQEPSTCAVAGMPSSLLELSNNVTCTNVGGLIQGLNQLARQTNKEVV